jgi:hypothetical protein
MRTLRTIAKLTAPAWWLIGLVAAVVVTVVTFARWHRRPGALILDCSPTWLGRLMSRRGWGGFTIGRCIFLWENTRVLLAHELQHVRQGDALGLAFPVLYLIENIRRGYVGNRFEIEAREVADMEAKQG